MNNLTCIILVIIFVIILSVVLCLGLKCKLSNYEYLVPELNIPKLSNINSSDINKYYMLITTAFSNFKTQSNNNDLKKYPIKTLKNFSEFIKDNIYLNRLLCIIMLEYNNGFIVGINKEKYLYALIELYYILNYNIKETTLIDYLYLLITLHKYDFINNKEKILISQSDNNKFAKTNNYKIMYNEMRAFNTDKYTITEDEICEKLARTILEINSSDINKMVYNILFSNNTKTINDILKIYHYHKENTYNNNNIYWKYDIIVPIYKNIDMNLFTKLNTEINEIKKRYEKKDYKYKNKDLILRKIMRIRNIFNDDIMNDYKHLLNKITCSDSPCCYKINNKITKFEEDSIKFKKEQTEREKNLTTSNQFKEFPDYNDPGRIGSNHHNPTIPANIKNCINQLLYN